MLYFIFWGAPDDLRDTTRTPGGRLYNLIAIVQDNSAAGMAKKVGCILGKRHLDRVDNLRVPKDSPLYAKVLRSRGWSEKDLQGRDLEADFTEVLFVE